MVLTAAMLQPPVFDPDVDDAVNYGALGATIGHEITHAFDERGRRYDASGDLRAWFSPEEDAEYERRSRGLVDTFNGFRPVPGTNVNGEMTLPENVADLAGLSVAYRAYQLSLRGKPAPVVDGFTGPQRFFLSYARMWRMKVRDNYLRQWVLSLQYAPEEFRTNGTVQHLGAFHDAFSVTAGDRLFHASDDRVSLW
jgi:predicted metalloendopeptidase